MDGSRELSPYDRVTVSLWARSHKLLASQSQDSCLVQAAIHAVLAGLRDCQSPEELVVRYSADVAPDFALIGSLLPDLANPLAETLWRIRDAAFYLAWSEVRSAFREGDR